MWHTEVIISYMLVICYLLDMNVFVRVKVSRVIFLTCMKWLMFHLQNSMFGTFFFDVSKSSILEICRQLLLIVSCMIAFMFFACFPEARIKA